MQKSEIQFKNEFMAKKFFCYMDEFFVQFYGKLNFNSF